jgi:hypothetical protein
MEGYLFGYSLPLSADVSECKLLRQYKIGPKKYSKKDADEIEFGGIHVSSSQKNLVIYNFICFCLQDLLGYAKLIVYILFFYFPSCLAPWRSGSVLGP